MSDFAHINPNLEDRGEAKYFHGRKGILDSFQRRLKRTEKDPKKRNHHPDPGRARCGQECAAL